MHCPSCPHQGGARIRRLGKYGNNMHVKYIMEYDFVQYEKHNKLITKECWIWKTKRGRSMTRFRNTSSVSTKLILPLWYLLTQIHLQLHLLSFDIKLVTVGRNSSQTSSSHRNIKNLHAVSHCHSKLYNILFSVDLLLSYNIIIVESI